MNLISNFKSWHQWKPPRLHCLPWVLGFQDLHAGSRHTITIRVSIYHPIFASYTHGFPLDFSSAGTETTRWVKVQHLKCFLLTWLQSGSYNKRRHSKNWLWGQAKDHVSVFEVSPQVLGEHVSVYLAHFVQILSASNEDLNGDGASRS